MCKALPYQRTRQNTQNSAEATDLKYNQREHMQNRVRGANVKKNQTQHIQNSAQDTTVKKIVHNPFKTVRKTLT